MEWTTWITRLLAPASGCPLLVEWLPNVADVGQPFNQQWKNIYRTLIWCGQGTCVQQMHNEPLMGEWLPNVCDVGQLFNQQWNNIYRALICCGQGTNVQQKYGTSNWWSSGFPASSSIHPATEQHLGDLDLRWTGLLCPEQYSSPFKSNYILLYPNMWYWPWRSFTTTTGDHTLIIDAGQLMASWIKSQVTTQ